MNGRMLLAALAILAVLAALDARRLSEARALNAAIATNDETTLRASDSPHARFALAALAAGRDPQAALAAYQSVEESGPQEIAAAARYNRAQLYHQLAAAARAEDDPRAIALAELAKQRYREVLAATPKHWDARYNLERVLRLVPDPPDDDAERGQAQPPAERAVTTMRGYTLGLP